MRFKVAKQGMHHAKIKQQNAVNTINKADKFYE